MKPKVSSLQALVREKSEKKKWDPHHYQNFPQFMKHPLTYEFETTKCSQHPIGIHHQVVLYNQI